MIRANEKQSLLERCYFAAYESDTSAVNYVRALLNGYGTEKKRDELRKVFMAANVSCDSYAMIGRSRPGSEREENRLEKNGLFSEWKSIVKMEPEIRTRAIEKIEGVLEKRVEGIMSANRRNYYGECAAYLAALGEAKESLGEIGAKQRLMTSYKDRYSRRNAFRAKMQAYGWIDMTKNKNY